MEQTVTKIKVGRDGGLRIPPSMVRKAGFKPHEETRLVFGHKRMIVGGPEEEEGIPQFADPSELLEYLDAQGKVQICRYDRLLANEDIPDVSPEQVHEMLKGTTVPVEEYLREERARVDDPLRA